MSGTESFILGEFQRNLDERNRLSVPSELGDLLVAESSDCVLVKERAGCISLWSRARWQAKLDEGVELIRHKLRAGKLEGKVNQVQLLGRLLSTRHKPVELKGRGRLLIPEGFREFLGVEPGAEVMVVGAAVCIEIWNPTAWLAYQESRMPKFNSLFSRLSD